MTDYEQRLRIALKGDGETPFRTIASGLLLAIGYERVVIGARGPYVEFLQRHLEWGNLVSTDVPHHYYSEWRTTDGVKVYCQRYRVDYADYRPGCFYVSPFELAVNGQRVIEELRHEPAQASFALEAAS